MLKRTPLYDEHVAWGARMVEFGGWEMPVQYSGVLEEHTAVRNAVGLFDISHMGRFVFRKPEAEEFLQHVATCDVTSIPVGQSSYGLLCHPDGGIIDDIFIYHLPNEYLVVVNASNRQKDWDWLHVCASNVAANVEIEDFSDRWAMLALQGPLAEPLLAACRDLQGVDVAQLPFHAISECRLFGINGWIARTGYTGEDGFELFFDAGRADDIWAALLKLQTPVTVKPCGLGARDSLRFEACLALYGHEIADDINPYEARLGWVVKLDKGDFIGREFLLQAKQKGTTRRLIGFEMVGRGIPRGDYPIQNVEGEPIGHVTTGMHSPTLGRPFGMGLVSKAMSKEGNELDVVIRNKPTRARVVKMPFYKPRYKR